MRTKIGLVVLYHGLPSVLLDLNMIGIFEFVARKDHHPLELLRLLPLFYWVERSQLRIYESRSRHISLNPWILKYDIHPWRQPEKNSICW